MDPTDGGSLTKIILGIAGAGGRDRQGHRSVIVGGAEGGVRLGVAAVPVEGNGYQDGQSGYTDCIGIDT